MTTSTPSFVDIGGRRIAYDEVSPDDPKGAVLLLTGLAAKRLGWVYQLQALGRIYRTIAIDHRDIGDSDPYTDPYTIADLAEDAAAVLRALNLGKAHVVGISMGGFVALELALRHPEMVERLVLVSTSAGGSTHTQPAEEFVGRMLLPEYRTGEVGERAKRTYAAIMAPGYCEAHPDEWERIAENARYLPQSAESYMRQWMACQAHDASGRLDQISIPTLVIHGDFDPLVPVQNGRYLAAHVPGARYIEYPDTGHIPIVERADDFNRDVLAFLAD